MTALVGMDSPIYVAGHNGMAGSAIVRRLHALGYRNIVTRTRESLDLRDQQAVRQFLYEVRPAYVFVAAAKVGGIHANHAFPAQFLYDNLIIATNVLHAAVESGIERLLFLGSSCVYPRDCPQPIAEHYLMTGPLEPTNEPYAIAKIAGIKLCESFNRQYGTRYAVAMPTNLYGPNDNYDLETSHVLAALLRKTWEAKHRGEPHVTVWGTGAPRREFLYVDDLAEACVLLMENESDGGRYNVGVGQDLTIRELAHRVMRAVGFDGDLVFDPRKPDGTPRKLLSIDRIANLGWHARTALDAGLALTYERFLIDHAKQ